MSCTIKDLEKSLNFTQDEVDTFKEQLKKETEERSSEMELLTAKITNLEQSLTKPRRFVTRPRPFPRSSNMKSDTCFVATTTSTACKLAKNCVNFCVGCLRRYLKRWRLLSSP